MTRRRQHRLVGWSGGILGTFIGLAASKFGQPWWAYLIDVVVVSIVVEGSVFYFSSRDRQRYGDR